MRATLLTLQVLTYLGLGAVLAMEGHLRLAIAQALLAVVQLLVFAA